MSNPFSARLLRRVRMTGPGSAKETFHYEVSLEGSGIAFEPGDSLGVRPANDPALVEAFLTQLRLNGDSLVSGKDGASVPLRKALLMDHSITKPSKQFLAALAGSSPKAAVLRRLLEPAQVKELQAFLWGRDILDLMREFGLPEEAREPEKLRLLLAKLQPRLYSIASSLRVHPEQAHLLVASVAYESHGRMHKGVCTSFLAERIQEGSPLPVFVHVAKQFHLPEDPDTPIIMVGPGTGLAPFRAFLQERQAAGARGGNWLFFGDQHRATSFHYQSELEGCLASGLLSRLDTAFSRDQIEKVYVQHRMLEAAREVWSWLEEGACLYVCGDAKRMAVDVEAALHLIIQRAGGLEAEEARAYVAKLRQQKRYRQDVY